VNQWIRRISDVTSLAHDVHSYVAKGHFKEALSLLPDERPYTKD